MAAVTHGSSDFVSGGNVTLVRIDAANDPQGFGPSWDYTYTGTQTAIDALAFSLATAGVRVRQSVTAGEPVLVASYFGTNLNGNPATEVPTDSWGFDTEGVNLSLFAHPTATREASQYATFALYKHDIEEALSNGTANPLDVGSFPFSHTIYRSLARGQDYYELRRPILRRNRTVSFQYTSKAEIEMQQRVWTTAALIAEFAVPADVQSRIPSDPSVNETPYLTEWGWLLTVDTSEYSPSLRRWTETKQWVFGAFDPLWYNIT